MYNFTLVSNILFPIYYVVLYGTHHLTWKVTKSFRFGLVWFMVFNAIFNNIFILEEETGVPWENHRPVVSRWQTLSHNVTYRVHIAMIEVQL
jgi:hypothetical protein